MADFRIWGRSEQIGPRSFLAIASAVPEDIAGRPIVLHSIQQSLAEANQTKERLMVNLGERVRAQGDHVVDVEED